MISDVQREDVEVLLGEALPWGALAGRSILVTGATGMVGQYLIHTLLAVRDRTAPARIIAMTRRGEVARDLFSRDPRAGALEILVHDPAQPLPPLPPLDYIVHAASPADPAAFRRDPVGVIAANALGSARLLEAARERGAVFCLLSSAEVYGQAKPDGGERISEEAAGVLDSLDLRSAYPESKRLAETLCVAFGHQHGVGYRIARLAHTYGPGMSLEDPRVQTYFMRQALTGQDIVLLSSGEARRSYTYVSDAVCGVLHLITAPENLACNVANEKATVSIAELARAVLARCPGTRAQLRFAPGQPETTRTVAPPLLDCSRLRALGWKPRVSLDQGIDRTLRHHRAWQRPARRGAAVAD